MCRSSHPFTLLGPLPPPLPARSTSLSLSPVLRSLAPFYSILSPPSSFPSPLSLNLQAVLAAAAAVSCPTRRRNSFDPLSSFFRIVGTAGGRKGTKGSGSQRDQRGPSEEVHLAISPPTLCWTPPLQISCSPQAGVYQSLLVLLPISFSFAGRFSFLPFV